MFHRISISILLVFLGLAAAQTTLSPAAECFNPVIQQLDQYSADITVEIDEFELIVDDDTISNRFNATREAVMLINQRALNLTTVRNELDQSFGMLSQPLFQILSAVGMLVYGVLNLLGQILDALGLGGLTQQAISQMTGIYNLIEAARQYIQSSDATLRACLNSKYPLLGPVLGPIFG